MSALYIGAGLDIEPIKVLKKYNKFIYIDVKPYNNYYDFNFINELCTKLSSINFFPIYSSLNIINKLNNNDNSFNFYNLLSFCCHENDFYSKSHLLEFIRKSDNCKINYYINTHFPNDINNKIVKEIFECTTLIISTFFPHKSIIDMMKKPINLILNEKTSYFKNVYEDPHNIISYLHNNNNNMSNIKNTILYCKEYITFSFNNLDDVDHFISKRNNIKYLV